MSNRDRIARAAAEAEAAQKQQRQKDGTAGGSAAKKATPARKSSSKKKVAAPVRTRIVWALCDHSGSTVQTFPYAQEQQARSEAERLTTATGKAHFVKQSEVPFE